MNTTSRKADHQVDEHHVDDERHQQRVDVPRLQLGLAVVSMRAKE